MGLVKCKKCGHQISDRAFRCPKCGCSVEKAKAELVNSERQVPCANPLFPKKQEGINHVVAEEKNKGNLAPKPKMSETSKDEKYFSIAVIVCVLMVGLIILGFIGRCSTKREVPKGGSVEKITEEIGKDASESALSAESRANNNDISWLYGIWECTTEYGKLQIEISESTITYKDGFDTERCSYRIDGNVLRMQGASYTTTFSLDFKERRIWGKGIGCTRWKVVISHQGSMFHLHTLFRVRRMLFPICQVTTFVTEIIVLLSKICAYILTEYVRQGL